MILVWFSLAIKSRGLVQIVICPENIFFDNISFLIAPMVFSISISMNYTIKFEIRISSKLLNKKIRNYCSTIVMRFTGNVVQKKVIANYRFVNQRLCSTLITLQVDGPN